MQKSFFAKQQYIDTHGRVLNLKSWNVFGGERKFESVSVQHMFIFLIVIHSVWIVMGGMQACQHRPQKTFLVAVPHVDSTAFVYNKFGGRNETETVKRTEYCDTQNKF